MYYVNARWLGGMLTNFKTMRGRVDRLNQLKKMQEDGTFDMLPKKEVIKHLGEIAKLEKYLGGVVEMKKLPGALFVVDPRKERNAINEARKLHIPIVAIVDTNCDPDEIDYVIPGNDDAIRAIKLISSVMANAIQEGKQGCDAAAIAAPAAGVTTDFVCIQRRFTICSQSFPRKKPPGSFASAGRDAPPSCRIPGLPRSGQRTRSTEKCRTRLCPALESPLRFTCPAAWRSPRRSSPASSRCPRPSRSGPRPSA